MQAGTLPPIYPRHLTRAGAALAKRLRRTQKPIVTPYELFREIGALYAESPDGLYLRKSTPELSEYRRLRDNLLAANILASDPDYIHRVYRILRNPDLPADDICCLVDPFCYISHLSAMQRYGLTDRRPEALHLSRPAPRLIRAMVHDRMQKDSLAKGYASLAKIVPLRVVAHPTQVRGRSVSVFQTVHPGEWIQVRGSFARLSTVGQTFLDMLEEPILCGGMAHVIDAWREYVKKYLDDVISVIDHCQSAIVKVRAGYILEEFLGINDNRIESWLRFTQRGGSRLLDPTKGYAPSYSERWMISINV